MTMISIIFNHTVFVWLALSLIALDVKAQPPGTNYRGETITGVSSGTNGPVSNLSNILSAPLTLAPDRGTGNSSNTPEFINFEGEKYLTVSFARLASFPFTASSGNVDPTDSTPDEEQVPHTIKSLNEKSVAVTGFMLPVHTADQLTTDFLLLRNQSACCYGIMPKINEWVVVRTAGKGVKIAMDVPITVLGTFHVGEVRENGTLTAIYKLDCDGVINPKE
jgi:hypothetical protein